MTPIEAALARVRELREAERKMTEGKWLTDPEHDQLVYVENDVTDGPIASCHYPPYGTDNVGIAALRNAAPTMLDLLEALLQREYVASDTGIDVERDARKKIAAKKINEALAAFVEGTDAA